MIEAIIKHYFLNPTTSIEILRNKNRLVAEVTVDGNQYFLKGEKQPIAFIEKTITFTKLMSEAGLPFITPEQTLSGKYYVEHEDLLFILERKGVGEEVARLRLPHIQEIGHTLGKQHRISERSNLRFGTTTSWGMFGGNQTDALGDYDENELCFLDLVKALNDSGQHAKQLAAIMELYRARRSILQLVWDKLPLGPVQGDLAPYNLLFQQDKINAVFDYDIAGDEVLINECIANAIYLAWHYDYEGNETPEQRYEDYIKAYSSERQFSDREQEMIPHLFAIIRAFRYDRIEEGIEQIKQGNGQVFLDETIKLLQG